MAFPVIDKDPNAVLDYYFLWKDWLDGDTISSKSVSAESGLTIVSGAINSSEVEDNRGTKHPPNTVVVVWLSGGTAGQEYTVSCRITTALSRTEDRSITINCVPR